MSGSTRIKGVALTLTLGSPAVDHKCDIKAATITNEEKDSGDLTFCDVENGESYDYFLNVTALQSTQADSFWDYVWENTGLEEVPYTYAPHGNEVPTADQPHFTGTLTIGAPPELGGEAGKDNTYEFETQFKLDGKPVKDTGA